MHMTFIPMGVYLTYLHYTYRGIGCQAAHALPGLIFPGKITAAQKKSTAQKSHALFYFGAAAQPILAKRSTAFVKF